MPNSLLRNKATAVAVATAVLLVAFGSRYGYHREPLPGLGFPGLPPGCAGRC